MRRRASYLWVALLFLPLILAARQQAPPKFQVRVDVASFDVEVLDKQGNPVLNLSSADFSVKEDGKQKEITHFSWASNRPLSLAIALDLSGVPRDDLMRAKSFISRLAHILEREDEICLLTFDQEDAVLEAAFTTDRLLLRDALENIDVIGGRMGALWKGLYGKTPRTGLGIDMALARLRSGANEKKALLVVSNRFNGLGPATVDHVRETGFTLATLGFPNKTNLLLTLGADQVSKKQLMRESGGRNFKARSEDEGEICRAIAFSLKNHYSLGYSTEVKPGDKKTRHVEITVPGKDYQMHARRSYTPIK